MQIVDNNFLMQLYDRVGSVGCILILLGVFAISLLIVKIWQFTKFGVWKQFLINHTISENIKTSDYTDAIEQLKNVKNPIANVMISLVRLKFIEKRTQLEVNTEIERLGKKYLNQLEQYLRPLEVLAHLSPLVGLLGTVLGIIMAFSAIKSASFVDPALLSAGISHALITTALGLSVAIPSQIGFHYLDSVVEKFRASLSDNVAKFIQQPIAS
ncbi:MAG: MotA/TolQ/ExbB proton channel family protein [Gammaproteobacteria bacterium]|nr:MAG: MotA/TolQ/ExbB proton channel family protein [Gammaproteobacteria bacterium]UTW42762.1 MotA/TolQ/ExbB proton channel family protein [bacterium SCSIO 12844]